MSCMGALLTVSVLVCGETHRLHVRLDPERSWLAGVDTVALAKPDGRWIFGLDPRLTLSAAREQGLAVDQLETLAEENVCWYYLHPGRSVVDTAWVVLRYEGRFPPEVQEGEFSHHFHTQEPLGVITSQGAVLGEGCYWFPSGKSRICGFNLTVVTPAGWEAIAEGARVERLALLDKTVTVWEADFPLPWIHLVAGPYQVAERLREGVRLYMFFYPGESDLVEDYLAHSESRLAMYNSMFGPYPYAKFAVVENFFPTGYAMPSFTLLGKTVLRLPFITEISLGHELLHNWWGNGVYVTETGGNWCEGLTTYLADYWYEQQKGQDWARSYRRQILLDYADYVGSEDEVALHDFVFRTTPSTRAVGYGKAAMVFHMLRTMLGDEAFFDALRLFYEKYLWRNASWRDLEASFRVRSDKELSWYFKQWVDRPGAPALAVEAAEVDGDSVRLRVAQVGRLYRLLIPIAVESATDTLRRAVWFESRDSVFAVPSPSTPTSVVVDPAYDVFRLLHVSERPAALGRAISDSQCVVMAFQQGLLPEARAAAVMGQEVFTQKVPPRGELPASVILVGYPTEEWRSYLSRFLPAGVELGEHGFRFREAAGLWETDVLVLAVPHPSRPDGIVVGAFGREDTMNGLGARLKHYGKYSYLWFRGSTVLQKGQWESGPSPLRRPLAPVERSFAQ